MLQRRIINHKYLASDQVYIQWRNTNNTSFLINESISTRVYRAISRKWLYLESILVESGDIVEKLPKELDPFTEVNKAFKKIMKQASLEKKSNLFVLTLIMN